MVLREFTTEQIKQCIAVEISAGNLGSVTSLVTYLGLVDPPAAAGMLDRIHAVRAAAYLRQVHGGEIASENQIKSEMVDVVWQVE